MALYRNTDSPYLEKPRLSPEELERYHAMSGIGAGVPQGGQQAPLGYQTPQTAPAAPVASPESNSGMGGFGGFLQALFNPQGANERRTKELLLQDGLDEGTATLLANDKASLRTYLQQRAFPDNKRNTAVIDGKLVDTNTGQVIGDYGSAPERKTVTVDGKLVDANTGEVIGDYSKPEPGYRTMTEDERKAAGLPDGKYQVSPTGQVSPISGTQPKGEGMVVYGPDGNPIVTTGGAKPFTEGQSKDTVFYTRAAGALPILDKYEQALTNPVDAYGGAIPGIGNYIKSTGYQQAEQAGREWLAAILRKDTGAAVTDGEMSLYGETYLPQPGNAPEVLEQKRAARQRANDALKAGMQASQILAAEQANRASPPAAPAPDRFAPGVEPNTDKGGRLTAPRASGKTSGGVGWSVR